MVQVQEGESGEERESPLDRFRPRADVLGGLGRDPAEAAGVDRGGE